MGSRKKITKKFADQFKESVAYHKFSKRIVKLSCDNVTVKMILKSHNFTYIIGYNLHQSTES